MKTIRKPGVNIITKLTKLTRVICINKGLHDKTFRSI